MVKLCYLLLCHKDLDGVIQQISYLVDGGGSVVVHADKNASKDFHRKLREEFANTPSVAFVGPVKAGWGDWSLVKATLRMIDLALDRYSDSTHFYYLSGDCIPIRPIDEIKRELADQSKDIIETSDFYEGNWIKTGPKIERVRFYHFINERKYKWLFYFNYDLQRLFGIQRKVPSGLNLAIGSQWWCLRRKTLERIRVFLDARPDVIKFFKWNWIPDEMFFQTLVATLVHENKRINRPPTFLRFSDYGLPTVFYDDHYNFLTSQREFFARKISPNARRLKKRLVARFNTTDSNDSPTELAPEGSGLETINFTNYAGRNGLRFGSRIWERTAKLNEGHRLIVIVSKKWHVGHRFGDALSEQLGIPYLGYLFDEMGDRLGDVGGFENDMSKRRINPAAFMQTVYSAKGLRQAIIGIDSSRFEELKSLSNIGDGMRVVELENEFSSDYLDGHAQRARLMSTAGSAVQSGALHRAIVETFKHESSRLSGLKIQNYERIRDWHNAKMRAEILSHTFERSADDFIDLARQLEIKD